MKARTLPADVGLKYLLFSICAIAVILHISPTFISFTSLVDHPINLDVALSSSVSSAGKPNVVFLLADDLGTYLAAGLFGNMIYC